MSKLSRILALVVVVGALLFGAYIAKNLIFGSAATRSQTRAVAVRLLALINQKRVARGEVPLRDDPQLDAIALGHSQDMLERGYFAHDGPTGHTFAMRVARLHRRLDAENLAWGTGNYAKPVGLMNLWLGSPEHLKNLTLPGLRRIGIGIVQGTYEGQAGAVVVTADFSS